jgi:diguanylate cyclase (GGDEF)-like protein/PAS domain S-box-containing protein
LDALKSALLDSIGDAIIAHTSDGGIVYVNDRAARLVGCSPDEIDGIKLWSWLSSEDADHLNARVAQILRCRTLVYEAQWHPVDGETLNLEIHSSVIDAEPWGEVILHVSRELAPRQETSERMRRLAFYDPLTGLGNRALLDTRMSSAIVLNARHDGITGVIYLDLDDFKPVNDTYGHAMGDRVLRIIAERMLKCVRSSDTIVRLGGDEFFVLFPKLASVDDLASKAKALAECIARPIGLDGVAIDVSASVGLATYREGEHPDELISRADHAMYRAKSRGRAGWEEIIAS